MNKFLVEVANRAGRAGLDAELEWTENGYLSNEETGRVAVTSPDEDEDRLVQFINDGPENWDYELTTAETGVPIVYVGVN